MNTKSFKTVPTPRKLTAAQADAFVNGRAQTGANATSSAPAGGGDKKSKEPTARLSLDISSDLHQRFKVACVQSRLKMTTEILAFIERRTAELEGTHK